MGLFNRKSTGASIDPAWRRAVALVISADAPPEGGPLQRPYGQGVLQVFVETPEWGRRTLSGPLRFADEHWVVPGVELPIAIDPARPELFAVDWPAVPTMQQLAAANHPALADPFGAARRIAATVGVTPSAATAARQDRFHRAVAAAATRPAPPGRFPAVAMTVTIRGRMSSDSDGEGGSGTSLLANPSSAAVLSVSRPGQPPYAVYQPRFAVPRRKRVLPGEPMPATVSATDPSDVDISWAELPGLDDQISARVADAASANAATSAALAQQWQAMTAQAVNAPAAGAGTGLSPQARQLLVDNLRRSLLYVTDPAQRELMLQQYRTMGLDITREELGF